MRPDEFVGMRLALCEDWIDGGRMKLVEYKDVPEMCDALLDEVAKAGTTFQVMKNGKAMLRIVPVDDETKAQFATERLKRKAQADSSAALRNDKQ